MVRVGDDLCKYLNDMGINTIHDTQIHDDNYTGAYKHSRKSVLKYLEQYPSIDITIDVHRDDITYENKTKVKPTAVVNGKKAARMMIIAGAEYGSVSNYSTWEYNLRFDMAVQNRVNSMYPSLMRPILFAERKYNMDLTHNSFLLEIGTDANTLDEATYSARLFATALGGLLKDDYIEK
jgi:stage II sporulation protein P